MTGNSQISNIHMVTPTGQSYQLITGRTKLLTLNYKDFLENIHEDQTQ